MVKQKGFYSFLKGEFLFGEGSFKNWMTILFVVCLLLIVVWSGHLVDEKVVKIAQLNKERRELRSIYVDRKTTLAEMKLESSVKKRVLKMGLYNGDVPPQKIIIKVKK